MGEAPEPSDEDLVRRVRDGDEVAAHLDRSADAVRKLYGRAMAAMAAKLRDAKDAE